MTVVARNEGYDQVCVWPGMTLTLSQVADFPALMAEHFGVRVQYLEEIKTAPDLRDGFPVEGTGGRNDLFFAVHNDDAMKFAVPRLQAGIRWIEDVLGSWNHSAALYPARVSEYKTWSEEPVDA